MAVDAGTVMAYLTLDSSGFQSAMTTANTDLTNFGTNTDNTLTAAGDKLVSFGTQMSQSFAWLRRFFRGAIDEGKDFELQMAQVDNVTQLQGETEQEHAERLEALTDAARYYGANTTWTAMESAEALQYMGMAGWTAEESIAALPAVLSLATASGESLGRTSDIVTDAMTAMGLDIGDVAGNAQMFADVMAATAINSNTNVSMMGETFKYSAALAGTMGYSVQDLALAIGLMANSGIKGSMAGTALRNLITNMAKPTETVANTMNEFGISLHDSEGNALPLLSVMEQLRSKFSGLSIDTEGYELAMNALNAEYASTVAEIESANNAHAENEATIMASNMTDEEKTAALEAEEEAYQNALAAIKDYDTYMALANNNLNTYMKSENEQQAQLAATIAGKYGMAGLMAIINASDEDFYGLKEAIDNSSGAAEGMADNMENTLDGSIKLMDSALSELKLTIAEELTPALVTLVGHLTSLITWFTSLPTPVQNTTIAIAGLAAIGGPVIKIVGFLVKAFPMIKSGLTLVTNPYALGTIVAIGAFAAACWGAQRAGEALGKGIVYVSRKLMGVEVDEEKEKRWLDFGSQQVEMEDGSLTSGAQIAEDLDSMFGGSKDAFDKGLAAYKATLQTEYADLVSEDYSFLSNGGVLSLFDTMFSDDASIEEKAHAAAVLSSSGLADGLLNGFTEGLDSNGMGVDFWDYVLENGLLDDETVRQEADKLVISSAEALSDSAGTALEQASEELGEAAADSTEGVDAAVEKLGDDLLTVEDYEAELATAMSQLPAETAAQVATGMGDSEGAVASAATGVSDAAVTAFASQISADKGKPLGAAIVQGIINGMKSKQKEASIAARTIGLEIQKNFRQVNAINSPSKVFAQYGQYIVQGLAQGISDTSAAMNASAQFARDVQGGFTGSLSSAGGYTQNITINSPKTLSAYEVARQLRLQQQELAKGWR